jgi:site-specific DNA-methyltransferase (adenine-specific)
MRIETIGDATLYLGDCLEAMREMPDKAFELAIVDPPYGAGDVANFTPRAKGTSKNKIHKETKWNITPEKEYYDELFRVSKNQIIWGANYLCDKLPISRGWIFWDKLYENTFNFSAGELAWSSFDSVLAMVRISQRWIPGTELNIHPTQKPVALYKWLLSRYAKPGYRILDTHFGSGSNHVACNDLGFESVGYELDEDYFNAACRRIADAYKQPRLFEDEKPAPKPLDLTF